MRTWVKLHPLKNAHENSPGHVILSKPPQTEVSFEFKPGANPASRQLKMTRYPVNPEPEWGPKSRFGLNIGKLPKHLPRNSNLKVDIV